MSWVDDTFFDILNKLNLDEWRSGQRVRKQRKWEKDEIRSFPFVCDPLRGPVQEILFDLEEQNLYVEGPYTGWERIGTDPYVHHRYRYRLCRSAGANAIEAYRTRYTVTANQDPLLHLEIFISVDAQTKQPFFLCRNRDYITNSEPEASGVTEEEFRYVLVTCLEPFLRRNINNARRNWQRQYRNTQLTALRRARWGGAQTIDDARRVFDLVFARQEERQRYLFQDRNGRDTQLDNVLDRISTFYNGEVSRFINNARNYGASNLDNRAQMFADLVGQAIERVIIDPDLPFEPLYPELRTALEKLQTSLELVADLAREINRMPP